MVYTLVLPPVVMLILTHSMLYFSTIGFGFACANEFIGISRIRNLKEMTLTEVKAHKLFGRTELVIFYILTALCIFIATLPKLNPIEYVQLLQLTVFVHLVFGGIIPFILVTIKAFFAIFMKNKIYKYGKFIGPIGFFGWLLAYFTSTIDFYFFVNPIMGMPVPVLLPNFLISLIFALVLGGILFLIVQFRRSRREGTSFSRSSLHGVAMILHGISFGYEGSTRELVGTPILYKYVFPKTYQFLERFAEKIGLALDELENHNLNEAMEIAMKKFQEIGMAEKIKIKWISNDEFSIETINCSTAVVRSYMKPEELENAICPWAILSATIVNKLTGKNLEIEPTKFNEIGSLTNLKIVEESESS